MNTDSMEPSGPFTDESVQVGNGAADLEPGPMNEEEGSSCVPRHGVGDEADNIAGAETGCGSAKIALKFLLSNVAAGIVIGKAGTNITELQEISCARIQLSRNNVFYPGTVERVLLLTGTVKSVLVALYLILGKLTGRGKWTGTIGICSSGVGEKGNGEHEMLDGKTPRGENDCKREGSPASGENAQGAAFDVNAETTQVKIVMPAAVCGAIIGKGGETIRHFAEDSGASISVSPQEPLRRMDRTGGVVNDRIVTVTGAVSQILRAVALVVTVVAEDPNYVKNVGLSVNYAPKPTSCPTGPLPTQPMTCGPFSPRPTFGPPYSAGNNFPTNFMLKEPPMMMSPQAHMAGMSAGFFERGTNVLPGGSIEEKLAVPDEHVGAIIGKGGEILAQLQGLCGVKVTISGRGEFEPGTRNRTVAISGTPNVVQIAKMLVTQKVNERIAQLQRQGTL